MARVDGRRTNQMRPVTLKRNFIKHAEGSVLIEIGDTKVACTASVDERQPRFMREQQIRNKGWVTGEYSMLPRSTSDRMQREVTRGAPSGRTQEDSTPDWQIASGCRRFGCAWRANDLA